MAKVQEHLLEDDTSSSSSSSSSDEEVVFKKGEKKDAGGPAGLCFMASSFERRSRHRTSSTSGFCTMALDAVDGGHPDSGSHDDDTSSEVSMTDEEILEILEDNRKELKRYAKITRKAVEA